MSARTNKIIIGTAALLLLAAAGTGWRFRQDLRENYRRWQQGPLPAPISAEQARELAPAAADDETLEIVAEPITEPEPAGAPEPATEPPVAAEETAEPETGGAGDDPVETGDAGADDELPISINLDVPMVYQAPFAVWDAKDEDACEEASMLMVQAFLDGTGDISRDEMRRLIDEVVDHEMRTIGYFESTDAATTVEIMHEYLGLNGAVVLPVVSIEDVKRELAAGRPVMLPASGKELQNPNFRRGGPVYHMLVAKGYKPGWIITNDPGTRKGADYLYPEAVLFEAIHDWNDGEVPEGSKVMIVVHQP